jgi:mannose-6-phosphate isomerase
MAILPMENTVRTYDWGSTSEIPRLTGIENPDGTPMAELWMGAHPAAPSQVAPDGAPVPLSGYIGRAPAAVLGREVSTRFGGRLPFLFKILSAGRALSIQAHPSLEQAREGFARENEAGIPLDAYERSYRDDNHKPELIRAVTRFWALRGFRSYEAIAEDFAGEEFAFLASAVAELLDRPGPPALERFFSGLMAADAGVVAEAARARARSAPRASGDDGARYEWVERLAAQFGADRGVAAPLYLNCLRLEPGDAMFLPAGTLHAYLAGTGVELMANSDNVLRGGLTSKHVDVDELIRTLVFAPDEPRIQHADAGGGNAGTGGGPGSAPAGPGWHRYDTPVPEFALEETPLRGRVVRRRAASVPEIVLALGGPITLREAASTGASGSAPVKLTPGGSAFVTADTGDCELEGEAQVFVATVPSPGAGGDRR